MGVSSLREWWYEVCEKETNRNEEKRRDDQLRLLETGIMPNPNIFLDEIADGLGKESGIYLNHSTLHHDSLKRDLDVCLKGKVLSDLALMKQHHL